MDLIQTILGFDEVGRGCLAGPVVVACVLGNTDVFLSKPKNIVIRDSKVMSRLQREKAALWISDNFITGIGLVEAKEIDRNGINKSVVKAAHIAFEDLKKHHAHVLSSGYEIMNDGNQSWFEEGKSLIKGDALIPEISMASIVAKVHRDQLMIGMGISYPDWGFDKHVGYGTVRHIACIRKYGLIPQVHRTSFCKKLRSARKIIG